jgi:hypothetical protein
MTTIARPVLCRCGHPLADHERTHHDHGTICWGATPVGTAPCTCEGCRDAKEEGRCGCRSFMPVTPAPAEAT